MRPVPSYLVLCGDRLLAEAGSLAEALRKARSCSEDVRVYRAEIVLQATPSEIRELLGGPKTLRQPAAAAVAQPAEEPPAGATVPGGVAVVFDQMFKRFAEILERELPEGIVFHEVLGRGIDRPIKVSQRVFQQPARDDYDVLNLLERLARENKLVIFFTGDKRLAAQARTLPRVVVEYLPPGELAGKEMAIKLMKERILARAHEALGMS